MTRFRFAHCAWAALFFLPTSAIGQSTSVLMLLPTEGRLEVGSNATGALSTSDPLAPDDRYLEAWDLRGSANQSVTIDVLADDFDPRVYLVGPGFATTQFADDGAGGCNARLTLRFLESGTFRVAVSSLSERETGPYQILVASQPGPAPAYGCGEMNPSQLNDLPIEGRTTLRLGSMQSGRLDALSQTVQDGRPAQAWRLQGTPGARLSIIMESDDFDSYLYLTGPGFDEVQTNDDGAGDLDAKIDVTLPTSGPFTVVASALSAGGSGSYTIRVEPPFDMNTLATNGRRIALGRTVTGELQSSDPVVADGRRGQAWAFEGVAGQQIVIDLEAEGFDTYLYLVGPGIGEPLSDDDSGGDLDSRIQTTLPGRGTYRVIASSLSDGTGPYTLRVTAP